MQLFLQAGDFLFTPAVPQAHSTIWNLKSG